MRLSKHLSFSLYSIIIILGSLLFFQSCNQSDKLSYVDGFKAGYLKGYSDASEGKKSAAEKKEITADPNFNKPPVTENNTTTEVRNTDIPQKAILVLDFIRKNNKAPDGYVGGRHFGNYEHNLPERDPAGSKIEYQEWDIQPQVEGKNRGAQRIITSSDGRAWYTADHYNSFTEMK